MKWNAQPIRQGCLALSLFFFIPEFTFAQSDAFVRLQSSTNASPQSGNVKVTGEIHAGSLRIGTSAPPGYVLTTNQFGVGIWAPVNGISFPYEYSGSASDAMFKISNGSAAGTGILGYAGGNGPGVSGRNGNGNLGVLGNGLFGVEGVHYSGNLGRLGTGLYGVQGINTAFGNEGRLGSVDYGVWGSSGGETIAVYGINQSANNYGYFGSASYGAYGFHDMSANYGYMGGPVFGSFGTHASSGNIGALGAQQAGVYGTTPQAGGNGVLGIHTGTSNQGYLGGAQHGVFGLHVTSQNTGALGLGTAGVYGYGAAGHGLYGVSISGSQAAVRGDNSSGGPAVQGVATVGTGVLGSSNVGPGVSGTSGSTNGVQGASSSATASGVFGDNTTGGMGVTGRAGGAGVGVYGLHTSGNNGRIGTTDYGMWADHVASTNRGYVAGSTFGLKGTVTNAAHYGVHGTNASSQNTGWLAGPTAGVFGSGVSGHAIMGTTGLSNFSAVYGQNTSGGPALSGIAQAGPGVLASSALGPAVSGSSGGANGIQGFSSFAAASGVYGENTNQGVGISGRTTGVGTAVMGFNYSPTGYAGQFFGRVNIDGTLTAAQKNFRIDHPLEPATKFLFHACVESNERINIYRGRVRTDAQGAAWVALPRYFGALNRDPEYSLTVLHDFARAIVAQEVQDNKFLIKTDKPNTLVSWQVSGVRHDAYARHYPMQDEVAKLEHEKGRYVSPEAYGLPASLGLGYVDSQERG